MANTDELNSAVAKSVESVRNTCQYRWADPIVTVRPWETKAFQGPDSDFLKNDRSSGDHLMHELFCSPIREMTLSIPSEVDNNDLVQVTEFVKTLFPDPTSGAGRTGLSSPKMAEPANMRIRQLSESSNRRSIVSISISEFSSPDLIEPIFCKAYLYSTIENKRVSDTWNFVPSCAVAAFADHGIKVIDNSVASFTIDSSKVDGSLFLVFDMYHTLCEDNSTVMLNYYADPTGDRKAAAVRSLDRRRELAYPVFTKFAWTYVRFGLLMNRSEIVVLPRPLPLDEAVSDLTERINTYSEQMGLDLPFKIALVRSRDEGSLIRSLPAVKCPLMYPVNNLVVKVQRIKVDAITKPRVKNPVFELAVVDMKTGATLKCIQSALGSSFVPVSFGQCVYHAKDSARDDLFVIKLPIRPAAMLSLVFSVYDVVIEEGSKGKKKLVGKVEFPLLRQNGTLFIQDGVYEVPLLLEIPYNLYLSGKPAIVFSTRLRSNFLAKESAYMEYMNSTEKSGMVDESKLRNLSDVSVVPFLLPLIDSIVKCARTDNKNMITRLILLRDIAIKSMPYSSPREFRKWLMIYVRHFALRGTNAGGEDDGTKVASVFADDSVPVHTLVMRSMVSFLSDHSIYDLDLIEDFIFVLIIKSLKMSGCPPLGDDYVGFIEALICHTSDCDIHNYMQSFGLFVNMLFDLGYCSQAVSIIKDQITFLSQDRRRQDTMSFVSAAFMPALIYFGSLHIPDMRVLILDLVRSAALDVTSEHRQQIFPILLRVFVKYDFSASVAVSGCLFDIVGGIYYGPRLKLLNSTLELLLFVVIAGCANTEILTQFVNDHTSSWRSLNHVVHLMIAMGTPDGIKSGMRKALNCQQPVEIHKRTIVKRPSVGWAISRRVSHRESGAKSPDRSHMSRSHAVISRDNGELSSVEQARLVLSVQRGICRFVSTLVASGVSDVDEVLSLIYHITSVSTDVNILDYCVSLIIALADDDSNELLRTEKTCITRILHQMMLRVVKMDLKTRVGELLSCLLKADKACHGNCDRIMIHIVRAAGMLDLPDIGTDSISLLFTGIEPLEKLVACSKDVMVGSYETRCEMLLKRAFLLMRSPDAFFDALTTLYNFMDGDSEAERFNIILLQAAWVVEVITVLKRVPMYYDTDHPCLKFCSLVSFADRLVWEPTESISMVGYCDSSYFGEFGYMSLLSHAMDIGFGLKIYERTYLLLNLIWPVLERARRYAEMAHYFQRMHDMSNDAVQQQGLDSSVRADTFFKVSMYGEALGRENGRTYVYRAPPLKHILAFTNDELIPRYEKVYGSENVIRVNESKPVDVETLDPSKIYIQVTATEALSVPLSGYRFDKFCFTTAFVVGSEKRQGDIDEQCSRRTTLTTKHKMPHIVSRCRVKEIEAREFGPLETRLIELEHQLVKANALLHDPILVELQPFLWGVLCVSVNVGPMAVLKMAVKEGQERDLVKKTVATFCEFMDVVAAGVKVHGGLVQDNPSGLSIQQKLEKSLHDKKIEMRSVLISHNLLPVY